MSEDDLYESEINFTKADMIIIMFFIVIDIFVMIALLIYFKTTITVIKILRYIIFRILLGDVLIYVLYLIKYSVLDIFKEVDVTIVRTWQFYLIVSFFDEIYSILIKTQKNKEIFKKIQMTLIFFVLTLSYDKLFLTGNTTLFIISLDKIILIIQSICAIFCTYKIYLILKNKNNDILNILKYDIKRYKSIHRTIISFPLPTLLLFSLYFCLEIIVMFFHGYYQFFGKLIVLIIKYSVKYFIFIINYLLLYEIKQVKLEEEKRKMDNRFIDDIKVVLK